MAANVASEVAKGFVDVSARPASVPSVWRTTDALPKPNGKLRFVIDRSAKGARPVWDGQDYVALDPNSHTNKSELPEVRWTTIQVVLEGGSIVADAARATGGTVKGCTYDMKDWFRQVVVRATSGGRGATGRKAGR